MNVYCIEVSHHTSAVAQRERLNFTDARIVEAYQQFSAQHGPKAELVILSTCNRVEIFGAFDNTYEEQEAWHLLSRVAELGSGLSAENIAKQSRRHKGEAVVSHLLRVASGLESQVLGEPQILGQVTQAHEFAIKQRSHGAILKPLFLTAIRAGKRARSETVISRNASSIGSVAVNLAARELGDLSNAKIVLLGAGAMGVTVLKALRDRKVGAIALLNRTETTAQQMAAQFGGVAYPMVALREQLNSADIVISATSATSPVIDPSLFSTQPERQTVIIDIAVPRDVHPAVGHIPNITLFSMDNLNSKLDAGLAERQQAIPRVETIIQQETVRYGELQREAETQPTLAQLHRKANEIREAELARTLRNLPDTLSPEVQAQLEAFSRSLVSKLLHAPSSSLRHHAQQADGAAYRAMVHDLFGLDQ